jgi:hypothetical protein
MRVQEFSLLEKIELERKSKLDVIRSNDDKVASRSQYAVGLSPFIL